MANETDKALGKKTLILAEAERIFAEKGYYGLGLSELLKSCDVPKGSFYYYFPGGKKQLLQEALEFSYRRMERGINGHILVEETALASFERMADHLAQRVASGKYFASLFLTMISIESVYLDESVTKPAADSMMTGRSSMRIIWCDLAFLKRKVFLRRRRFLH